MKYIKTKKTVTFNLIQDQGRSTFEESEDSMIIDNKALIIPEALAKQETCLRSTMHQTVLTPPSLPTRIKKVTNKDWCESVSSAIW
jgi:hypothetical protein